ncbi:hypothetical protein LguiB_017572 [Lonicera macranthoides]
MTYAKAIVQHINVGWVLHPQVYDPIETRQLVGVRLHVKSVEGLQENNNSGKTIQAFETILEAEDNMGHNNMNAFVL